MQEKSRKPAGFCIRLCAGLIDLTGVAAVVVLAAEAAASFGQYVPVELTVIVVYAVYTAVGIAWTGKTVGKWLCGVEVTCRDGRIAGPVRSAVRAALVAISHCLLGLPLLIIAARRSKRGWHDYLAGTQVDLSQDCRVRRRWAVTLVCVTVIGWAAARSYSTWNLYRTDRAWCADADTAAEKRLAHADPPVEVGLLDDSQRRDMAAWLADHGRDPTDYVVDLAAQHQVTLIGEIHGQKQFLAFLNRIIPRLYHEAGVRVIALECCCADQNDELERLVSGPRFDRELAMEIARGAVWAAWGYRGYWDVLETTWRLNRSLSTGQEPLQVVGISPRVDMPSFALLKGGPLLEKYRIVRLLLNNDLPPVIYPDAHYARSVERVAFERDKRTVVWVGAAHARLCCSRATEKDGRIRRTHRMGSMLHGRYGDRVAQVILHNEFSHGGIARLVEECTQLSSRSEIAFEVGNSPFAGLRDAASYSYRSQPDRRFADVVSAYIMLAPCSALEPCDWLDGFLSRRMFGRNKPFYEMICQRKLTDHHEANRHMSKGIQRL